MWCFDANLEGHSSKHILTFKGHQWYQPRSHKLVPAVHAWVAKFKSQTTILMNNLDNFYNFQYHLSAPPSPSLFSWLSHSLTVCHSNCTDLMQQHPKRDSKVFPTETSILCSFARSNWHDQTPCSSFSRTKCWLWSILPMPNHAGELQTSLWLHNTKFDLNVAPTRPSKNVRADLALRFNSTRYKTQSKFHSRSREVYFAMNYLFGWKMYSCI